MDSVSLFVSQVGAAFGQPDMPAASVAFAGQPAPEGSATEMQFEKLFAELLGEAKSAMEPTAPLPAKPLESDKEPDAAPVLFLPLDIPQNPAPLPLDLLNLSLPKPEKAAESEAPRANTAIADGDPGVPAPAPAKSPEGKVAAFEGRLLEMQEPEPVPAAAPAPAAPKSAPPAAGRVAAASAVPAPAQRAGEKESSNRQPEGPLMMTESNRAPLAETEAEQVSAQPAARAEQVELGETQPQPPAAHGINVRLGDDPASTVHLRVAERAGEIHFDVRAANVELAGALREGLPDLVRNLQNSGYQAEIWNAGKEVLPTPATAPGSGEFREDPAGQRQRRDSQPRQQNKNSPRRKPAFSSAV